MATPAAVLSVIVEANTGKAEAALKEFQRNLSKADREKAEAELAFQVEKGGYNVFSGLVKKADAMSAKASLEFDVDQASLVKARAGQALLAKESSKLGDVFNRSQLSIGQWGAVLAASIPVVFDLAGALGALVGSLGAATAGLGALAVGIGGVMTVGFGGIAAIAAPAISSLKDLMTAQDAASKARVTGAGSAARASVASAQQIIAAEQQVETAQQSAELAQESLTQARQDAVRQLQDMRLAAKGAAANEESAQISLTRARQNLRQVMRDEASGALDVREAENEVVLARQNLRDVTVQGNRAQKDYNAAQRGGISQMDGVVSAQQSLDSATQGVADAMRNLATQQKEANMATAAGGTSLAALALAQKKAGPAAVKFAQHIKEMGKRWRALTREGKNDFFGMLDDGVSRLNRKLPMLAESATRSMEALRAGFDAFLKKATGPEFDHFIEVMTVTFARAVKPLAGAFGNIAKVLQRIAVAVAPDIVRMAKGFEDMTQGWADSTRNAGRLRETIHGLVNQANAWWKLIKATGELIVAVLVPGMGQGKRAVEGITETLKGWTDWVRGHPEEMKNFFKDGLETTKQLAQALLSFLPTLVELSKAMRPIARAFLVLVKGLNSLKIGSVSALTVLLGAVVATKLAKGIVGMTAAFGRLKAAALGAAAAEKVAMLAPSKKATAALPLAAEGGIAAQAAQGPAVLATPKGMNVASMAKYAKVAGGVAVAVTAVAGAFLALRDNFLGVRDVFTGFFDKVLKPLGDAFTDLIDELSGGHAAQVFGAIGVALGTIAKPLKFVVTNLTKLVGLLAIGGITTGFVVAITAIAAPIWLAIKAITLLVKGLKHLGRMVADVAKFIKGAWITPSVLIAPFRVGVRKALDIFAPMKGKVGDIAKDIGRSLRNVLGSAWDATKDIFRNGAEAIGGAFGRVGKRIGSIAKGIRKVFTGLAKIIHKVADFIVHAVDRMVGALGSIKDKIGNVVPSLPSLPSIPDVNPFQRGGVVPGTGVGDKVHAKLPVGSGIINKKAADVLLEPRELALMPDEVRKIGGPKAIERINKAFPRFQGGGVVDRTGIQHFAEGGMAGPASSMARKFVGQFGGSITSGLRPGDDGFHGSGQAFDWVGGNWAAAAKYANRIGPKLLEGIYSGGQGPNVSWDSGQRVSPSFWGGSTWAGHADHIHIAIGKMIKGAVGAALEKIKRIKIEGKGPLADIAQGSADTMRKAANQYLAKIAPKVGIESGVTKGMMSKGEIASVWRRANQDQGSPGLMAAIALAESAGNPRAVGHDPGGTQGLGLWQITTGFNDDLIRKYGGRKGMFNAANNAQAAGDILERQGLNAWVVYSSGAYRQHLKQGGVVDKTGVKHQALAAPYVGSFDKGGEVAKTGFGLLHEGERVVPKMAQGGIVAGRGGRPDAQGGGRRGDDRRGGGLGVERIQRIRERLGKQLSQVVPKLDEEIDIAQRLAGLTTSPGGSEMAKSEIDKQLRLQRGLLRILRNTLNIAKRGMRMVQRVMKRIEDGIKELQRKIAREQKQMEQQVKKLTKFIESERKKDKPDQKKIEKAQGKLRDVKARHARPLERWQKELGKYNKATPRLPEMRSGFREAIVELSGLTGRGGRIFDTTLAIKELRAQGKPQAIGIEDLLSFAEAMRFGAFDRQLRTAGNIPTFAKGGVHRGGLALVGEKGPEVVQMPPAQVFPTGTAPAMAPPVVEITFADGMGWLKDFVSVEIKNREQRERGRWRRDNVAR